MHGENRILMRVVQKTTGLTRNTGTGAIQTLQYRLWYHEIVYMLEPVMDANTDNEDGLRLLKLLMRADVFSALMLNTDEVCEAVPEVRGMIGFDQRNPHHPYDAWVHTAHCVAYAAPVPILRLALLMHDIGKPETFYLAEDAVGHFNRHEKRGEEITRKRLHSLGFDRDTIDTVAGLVRRHDKGIAETELTRWLEELGIERLRLLLDVKEADARAHDAMYKKTQLVRVAALRRLLDEM